MIKGLERLGRREFGNIGTDKKYVVCLFSMRSKWLKRNPDRTRIRMRILSKDSFAKILTDDSPQPTLPRRYRRWVEEDGLFACKTEALAWKVGYLWLAELRDARRNVELNDPSGYRLYAFEMTPTAWNKKRFAASNEHLDPGSRATCLYVGKTSRKPRQRYMTHTTKTNKSSTVWGRDYFIRPFETAYKSDLLNEYVAAGFAYKNLKASEACVAEEHLAQWLRGNSYAVYFA